MPPPNATTRIIIVRTLIRSRYHQGFREESGRIRFDLGSRFHREPRSSIMREPGQRSNALRIYRPAFLGLGGVSATDVRYSVDDPVGMHEVAGIPAICGERPDVDADRNPRTVGIFVIAAGRVED